MMSSNRKVSSWAPWGGDRRLEGHGVNHRRRRRLVVESLENRQLMAVDMLSVDGTQYDPTKVLVQFRDTAANGSLIGSSIAGSKVTRQIATDGWYELTVASGSTVSQVLQNLQSRTDVMAATPDFRVQVSAVPNDPNYASQWALENAGAGGVVDADIDASAAWDYGTSSSVVVAVIDTGIDYTHVDLVQNIWTNTDEVAGNGIDDDRNGYVDDIRGWNFADDNNNPMDDNGHGTHVAGTIGAVGNNGVGIAGVAWNVKMMALKFLAADGSGMLSDAVAAIDYARVNGAKIINASWGGGGFSSALQSAMQRFQSAGGIFVAAAGNEASNNALVASYPANYALANVVSVAASTQSDALASFSNYGTNVDIAAPGNQILSTIPGNRYTRYSGTSMAAPHVAGAMALLWGQSPSLTSAQLIDVVMQNTDSVLTNRTIHGRLNVGKAAAALAGNSQVDNVGPQVLSAIWNVSAGSVGYVDVTFSERMRSSSLTTSSLQVVGPNGAIAITSITPLNSSETSYRIAFASQSVAGSYQLIVQSTVTDAAGNRLDQDRDGISGEATQDQFRGTLNLSAARNYTTTGPIAIADATRTRSTTTTVGINVPDSLTITDLNVDLSIDHTYVSDLRIRLIAPDGTSVLLVNRRGGSRDNVRVVFDDEATSSIASVAGNLSGTFRPEQALTAFDGKNAAGRWTLEIVDLATQDVGRVNSVTLQISSATAQTASLSTNQANPIVMDNPTGSWLDWIQRQLRRIIG